MDRYEQTVNIHLLPMRSTIFKFWMNCKVFNAGIKLKPNKIPCVDS